jgi:hypothetical protein
VRPSRWGCCQRRPPGLTGRNTAYICREIFAGYTHCLAAGKARRRASYTWKIRHHYAPQRQSEAAGGVRSMNHYGRNPEQNPRSRQHRSYAYRDDNAFVPHQPCDRYDPCAGQ